MGRFLIWFLSFIFTTTIVYMFTGVWVGQGKLLKYTLSGELTCDYLIRILLPPEQ